MKEKVYSIVNVKAGDTVVATDFTEDRDGERIDPDGVSLENFKQNPVLLWGHDHHELPIGLAKNIRRSKGQILFEPIFSEAHQMARDIKALWDEGVLRAVSIGFIPKKMVGNVFTETELLEISVVNVPSNPAALALARSKGLNIDLLIAASDTGLLPFMQKETAWDYEGAVGRVKLWAGGPDKENMDWARYGTAFAWHDQNDDKNFSAYKLPFADIEDNELRAHQQGITKAMGLLLGAKGGVDLTDSDRRAVYGFLTSYYKAMGKEAPEFKNFETISELLELKGKLADEDLIDLVSVLHQKETSAAKPEVEPVVPPQEEMSVDQAQANVQAVKDALHLFVQQLNKETNLILRKVNQNGKR